MVEISQPRYLMRRSQKRMKVCGNVLYNQRGANNYFCC